MLWLKKIQEKIINTKSAAAHEGDSILLVITALLLIFGLVILFSASTAVSYAKYGNSLYVIQHQLFSVLLGVLAFLFFSKTNYNFWKKSAFLLLVISIILLSLVFIPGLRAGWGSARSWINIFGFSIQPSEFVKIFFLLYLSAWIEKRKYKLRDFNEGIAPFSAIIGIIVVLMLLQPDFGTLSIILAASVVAYFVGGGKIRHIILVGLVGTLGLAAMVQLKSYQQDRFRCLADPEHDSLGKCYQVNQALIAVGSGGIFGRGLGASRQKFMYLPEVTGDSIFAVIGEELGFVFSLILIMLYLGLFYRGWLISKKSPDEYAKIASIGISFWLVFQAIINIGGIINFIPMTGVPLPLISSGGSSIIASMAAVGLLHNISKYTKL